MPKVNRIQVATLLEKRVLKCQEKCLNNNYLGMHRTRDTHIMIFKVPIMVYSNSQHQANYAHCFVRIMLLISLSI